MYLQWRRLTGSIATITLIAVAAGCSAPEQTQNNSQSSDRTSQETASAPSVSPPLPEVHDIGEVIAIEDQNLNLQLTVNGVREHPGKGVIKPNQGNKWVVVDTLLSNKGQEPKTFSVVSFEVVDDKNNAYEVALLAGALEDVELPTGEIAPGEERRGKVVFEVPETANELKLLFKPNSNECAAAETESKASESLKCEPIAVKLD
ncbi:DUF4352 domain-containing protein [Coleofasciculus sp. LEGE 07092]|nr:DUF4352 domain-containing protein [Coleofasciculus sp. LEGE 07081]MBE9126414.1 DUF4352 domain-containing protein [Coleofasciculus sp. LEGE 07081]MBE9149807.1 DUF4352 domain-containing protein [Coleofasciculus sp. LEGE 07092]